MFKKTFIIAILATLPSQAFIMTGSQVNAVEIEPGAVILDADTSGRYVGNITASDGITTTGASDGEDISHGLSVDQSFDFLMTGNFGFTPAGTDDVTINTDADSQLKITGLATANGNVLCEQASNVIGQCDDAIITGDLTANNFSGSSSGTNTGDQTITLTGDVTGSGTGSFATTIAANSVALTTDTTGNYVGTLVAGTGISTTGASTGEGIAHTVSVDQSFSPVWTGQHTYFGTGAYTSETHVLDQSGDPATKKSVILYTATGMAPGELSAINFTLIDTADATGGQISNINCQMIPTGSADVACMFAGSGVFPVVAAAGSPPAAPSQAWRETSGPTFTDSTTAFGSAGTDVQIFVNDNDYIYVGEATSFFEIQVALATAASSNVMAKFEYWNGSAWTAFVPNDGTAGFTRSGNITFNKDTLLAAGWVANSVNSVSKFYIRIQRTENTLTTPPTEDTIILADGIQNQWDPDGLITAQNIKTQGTGDNDISGKLQLTGTTTSHETCDASNLGKFEMFDNGANKTSLCICEKTGVATYSWGNVTSGGAC